MRSITTVFAILAVTSGRAYDTSHTLEGRFGCIEIDVEMPALATLTLRREDGSLEPHSLLSPTDSPWQRGMFTWGTQALTFVVDEAGLVCGQAATFQRVSPV